MSIPSLSCVVLWGLSKKQCFLRRQLERNLNACPSFSSPCIKIDHRTSIWSIWAMPWSTAMILIQGWFLLSHLTGTFDNVWIHFWFPQLEGVLLASPGYMLRILLIQCTRQPLTAKNYLKWQIVLKLRDLGLWGKIHFITGVLCEFYVTMPSLSRWATASQL